MPLVSFSGEADSERKIFRPAEFCRVELLGPILVGSGVKEAGLGKRRSWSAVRWPQKPKLSPGGALELGRLPNWGNRTGYLYLGISKSLNVGL